MVTLIQMALSVLWIAVVTTAISTSTVVCLAEESLSVSIAIDLPKGTVKAVNVDNPLKVVLKNNSAHSIKIWHPKSPRGSQLLAVGFKNTESGEVFITKRRPVPSQESSGTTDADVVKSLISLAPGEELAVDIALIRHQEWLNIPEPNTGAKHLVKAIYQSAANEGSDPLIWSGSIVSEPIELRLVSVIMTNPHDYLASDFPKLALRIMKKDPRWIERKNQESQTPLHVAAKYGHLDVVQWLLNHGANVNAQAKYGFTPLHSATSPDVVSMILKYRPDLSIRNSVRLTPLQMATNMVSECRDPAEKKNWQAIADLYLAAGADEDVVTAIQRNDVTRVKSILSKLSNEQLFGDAAKAQPYNDPPRKVPRVDELLRLAASLGHFEICKYLIEDRQMNVNHFDKSSQSIILKDALPHPEIVRLLINNGVNVRKAISFKYYGGPPALIGDDATALHYAAQNAGPETIKLLIDAGVDVFALTRQSMGAYETEYTSLEIACIYANAENVKAIVDHARFDEINPKTKQETLDRSLAVFWMPRWMGGKFQLSQVKQILLDKGANPNAVDQNRYTAIQLAAGELSLYDQFESEELKRVITTLVDHGGRIDLYSAIAIQDEATAARLLSNDPSLANSRSCKGYPALLRAVDLNDKKMVTLLLDAGSDVNIKSEVKNGGLGDTALHKAAYLGKEEMAELLLTRGANVNSCSEGNTTPLHEAAQWGSLQVAKVLLNHGANLDAKDDAGKTPVQTCDDSIEVMAHEVKRFLLDYKK